MAGHSTKPLLDKLGLKAGMRARLLRAVYQAPPGVKRTRDAPWDFIHLFAKDRANLITAFPPLAQALAPAGMLRVSWPKRASGVTTDLDENFIRKIGLQAGLVDIKVCAVDDVWSGLKFVIPLRNR